MSHVIDKQVLRAEMRDRRRAYAATLATDTRAALEDQLAEALQPLFVTATIIADGVATPVPVNSDEDLLTAALRAGLDLPYSCRAGMCSTCRARITQGTVAMAVNFGLEPWETKAGFVLTCQARPTTPGVTVDYDHA